MLYRIIVSILVVMTTRLACQLMIFNYCRHNNHINRNIFVDCYVVTTTDIVVLIVVDMRIPDDCIDQPQYADCDLIVKGSFCKHHIYSEFCCRACHEAGQLP